LFNLTDPRSVLLLSCLEECLHCSDIVLLVVQEFQVGIHKIADNQKIIEMFNVAYWYLSILDFSFVHVYFFCFYFLITFAII